MELIVTDKIYRKIMSECKSSHNIETGGILIGKRLPGFMVVIFALGPGIKARRTRNRFSPDIQWQQAILEKLFNRHGVNYVGSYHFHPENDCLPSRLDLKVARQVVSDPEWNAPEAIFPIVSTVDHEMKFFPYYFSRTSEHFQLIDRQIIPHADPVIRHILKRRVK